MNRNDPPSPPPTSPSARSIRLTFRYEGGQAQLVSRQPVAKVTPLSDPIAEGRERSGFWYEVQDAEGRTLYRRTIENPMRTDTEVFSNDPNQSISRVAAPPTGAFALVVPDIEQGQTVVFFSSGGDDPAGARAARAVQSFNLR